MMTSITVSQNNKMHNVTLRKRGETNKRSEECADISDRKTVAAADTPVSYTWTQRHLSVGRQFSFRIAPVCVVRPDGQIG